MAGQLRRLSLFFAATVIAMDTLSILATCAHYKLKAAPRLALTALEADVASSLTPRVHALRCDPSSPTGVTVDSSWRVAALGASDPASDDGFAAAQLAAFANTTYGLPWAVVDSKTLQPGSLSKVVILVSAGGVGDPVGAAAAGAAKLLTTMFAGHSDEGYALSVVPAAPAQRFIAAADGAPIPGPFVVVLANTTTGAYWGSQTVKQLLRNSTGADKSEQMSGQAGAVTMPACTVADYPAMAMRGMELNGLGDKAPMPSFYTRVDTLTAHKANVALMELFGDVAFNVTRYGSFMLALQQYVRPRHMEFIPEVGVSAGNPASIAPETGEGKWVRGEGFATPTSGACTKDVNISVSTACDLVPVLSPIAPLKNGGFETRNSSSGATPTPADWTILAPVNGGAVSSWALDTTVFRSGNASMRLTMGPAGGGRTAASAHVSGAAAPAPSEAAQAATARLVSDSVGVTPNSTYSLSVFWRGEGMSGGNYPFAWLVQLDAQGNRLEGLPNAVVLSNAGGAGGAGGGATFVEGTVTFVTAPTADSARVYIGGAFGGAANGTVWIDDILLMHLDSALLQVIRTAATDVVVAAGSPPPGTTPPTGPTFKMGTDVTVIDATARIRVNGVTFRNLTAPGAAALDGSRLSRVVALPAGGLVRSSDGAAKSTAAVPAVVYVWYDFQPGAMGHHDYDLWSGMGPHMPWPPSSNASADAPGARALEARAATSAQTQPVSRGHVTLGSSANDLNVGAGCPCFAEPAYYAAMNDTIWALVDLFASAGHPLRYIELGHDELRGIARDSRSLTSGKTNGQLLAASMNALTAMAKAAAAHYSRTRGNGDATGNDSPASAPNDGIESDGITVMFWDDMLNPWHLHRGDQDNLQRQWYGREDRTLDTALSLITDHSTVFMPWFYTSPIDDGRITGSQAMYDSAGFGFVGCPYEQLLNVQEWAGVVHNSTRGLGLIDTDWDKTFGGAVSTASLAWNPENVTVPLPMPP